MLGIAVHGHHTVASVEFEHQGMKKGIFFIHEGVGKRAFMKKWRMIPFLEGVLNDLPPVPGLTLNEESP
jgi:hypothetical protein